jgi:hypothetical protein
MKNENVLVINSDAKMARKMLIDIALLQVQEFLEVNASDFKNEELKRGRIYLLSESVDNMREIERFSIECLASDCVIYVFSTLLDCEKCSDRIRDYYTIVCREDEVGDVLEENNYAEFSRVFNSVGI